MFENFTPVAWMLLAITVFQLISFVSLVFFARWVTRSIRAIQDGLSYARGEVDWVKQKHGWLRTEEPPVRITEPPKAYRTPYHVYDTPYHTYERSLGGS